MHLTGIKSMVMKSLIVKSIFILLVSFGLYQTAGAAGCYYHLHPYFAAPRVYVGPRFVPAPVVCAPVIVPGHFMVNRFGVRVWVPAHRV